MISKKPKAILRVRDVTLSELHMLTKNYSQIFSNNKVNHIGKMSICTGVSEKNVTVFCVMVK